MLITFKILIASKTCPFGKGNLCLGLFGTHTCIALEVAVFVDGRIEDTVDVPKLPGNGDNIAEHVLEDGLGGQHGVPQVVEGARAVAAVGIAEECQRVHQNLHFRNLKHVEFVCVRSVTRAANKTTRR